MFGLFKKNECYLLYKENEFGHTIFKSVKDKGYQIGEQIGLDDGLIILEVVKINHIYSNKSKTYEKRIYCNNISNK